MRRVASVILALGAVVAVLGVTGVALGFRPSALPPALLDIAAFKLVFMAAGGLIIAGAVLGRVTRGRREQPGAPVDSGADGRQLPAGGIDVNVQAKEPAFERKHNTP